MKLYLLRHAESEDGPREDPTRTLTSIGRKQAALMGEFLVRQVGRVDIVLTSYFARAQATAAPIAELLGCELTIDTPMLTPDTTPEDAWKEIQFLAGELEDVLVVTHHPLTNELLKLLTGCDKDEFKHAEVAYIEDGKLRWLVPPPVVERDEDDVLEAMVALADATLEELREAKPTGLRHKSHQATLAPARAKLQKLFAGYFERQGAAVLDAVKQHIPRLLAAYQEADTKGKHFASSLIPSSLQPLRFAVTADEEDAYSSAITSAIAGAAKTLAAEMKSGATIGDDVAGDWLRENSLTKLTGGFSDTTVQRLRDAIGKAWDEGGSADQIVGAIKDTFADFSDSRAETIAQTEANNAYSVGRAEQAEEAGMEEKRWNPSGECCDVCQENVDAGWIDIDDDFPTGDSEPTAHPRCDCDCSYRKGHSEPGEYDVHSR